MGLIIAAFGEESSISDIAHQINHPVVDLQDFPGNTLIAKIRAFASSQSEKDHVLILHADEVLLQGNPQGYVGEFQWRNQDVLIAASAHYRFDDETLRYYFWKYYPRHAHHIFHYLDSRALIGTAKKVKTLFAEIESTYPADELSYHDLLTRWFVEYALGVRNSELKVTLDFNQDLFGSLDSRTSAFKFPFFGWMHEHLFIRAETEALTRQGKTGAQHMLWDMKFSKRRSFSYNHTLKSTPTILLVGGDASRKENIHQRLQNTPVKRSLSLFLISFRAYLRSVIQFVFAWIINRGETRYFRIFRYTPNASPEWAATMRKFLAYLDNGQGFTFAHFNDGEMTFIKKYLEQDHRETWFGRRQQKYNQRLGEQLTNALKLKKERYHVGIPCSTHHPRLRQLADSLIPDKSGVVPAMTLHHNLRFYPNIIEHMRNRECFFIMNEHQKLDVLEKLGVAVKAENKTIVPFKNSYLLFDELKDRKFPDGAIVILICGMLAKILIPEWFENNPNTTFLALGSSMDDFIQRTNTKFTLYPKEGLPLTCNIQPTKFFVFGWKKECKECWDMAEALPGYPD